MVFHICTSCVRATVALSIQQLQASLHSTCHVFICNELFCNCVVPSETLYYAHVQLAIIIIIWLPVKLKCTWG